MENSQSNKVYNYVLEQIKSGKWHTGEKIYTEKELCEKLEVSRIAVRGGSGKILRFGNIGKKERRRNVHCSH